MRISQARARGAKLIVIDPRKTGMAEKADLWLRVRPGSDGALALGMIHVLLEEKLYDEPFVREWTNGALPGAEDTQQLLTAQDLSPAGHPQRLRRLGWPERWPRGLSRRPRVRTGRRRASRSSGTYTCHPGRRDSGAPVGPPSSCSRSWPPSMPRSGRRRMTWVPAGDVRRAVRMFATEQPSCYYSWVGLEQHTDATQTNRAVALFYALTGQFDQRGSNVLFASTPTNPVMGHELLPTEQAVPSARRLPSAPWARRALPGMVPAYDVYRAILTGHPYPVKALVTFGTDLLLGHGGPLAGQGGPGGPGLLRARGHVRQSQRPLADLLLPASTCWEREALLPSHRVHGGGHRHLGPVPAARGPTRCTSRARTWRSSLTWPNGWAWATTSLTATSRRPSTINWRPRG